MTKSSFAILGCGKLGTALAKHLKAAGYELAGLTSKSAASAEETARIVGTEKYGQPPCKLTVNADVVFITTPDGIISDACKELVLHKGLKNEAVVLHCSGAHPSTILSSAKDAGYFIGSMHPLQSFASKQLSGNPFDGIIISVEGTDRAVAVAKEMATDLGANCITIRTDAKTLYHASAVVASNYLVTLIEMAVKFMETAGIPAKEAFLVLKPLVNGTLSNIEKVGIPEALTGPIARGDAQTVKEHIAAIISRRPDLIDLYKILGRYTVDIARDKGGLTDEQIKALMKLLKV